MEYAILILVSLVIVAIMVFFYPAYCHFASSSWLITTSGESAPRQGRPNNNPRRIAYILKQHDPCLKLMAADSAWVRL